MRKLPDGAEVSLDTGDGAQLALKSGRSRFTLQVLPESDFPDLTTGEFPTRFALPARAVKKLIDRTQFAISTEETRYYLNGIYLHVVTVDGKPMLRAVATDGHRLAQAQLEAPAGSENMAGVIVPRKTVGEIQKLVEAPDADVDVELSDTKIRVTIGDVVLTSKLIDGTFPDYARVIPQGNDKVLKVDRGEFADAVDRVSTISSERGRAVKLGLSDGKMVLSVNNPDSGSAVEELGVDYPGDADRDRLQLALPARRHRPARDRAPPIPLRRSRLADPDPRRRRLRRALRAHADAGVSGGLFLRQAAKLRRKARGVMPFRARNRRLKLARLA